MSRFVNDYCEDELLNLLLVRGCEGAEPLGGEPVGEAQPRPVAKPLNLSYDFWYLWLLNQEV